MRRTCRGSGRVSGWWSGPTFDRTRQLTRGACGLQYFGVTRRSFGAEAVSVRSRCSALPVTTSACSARLTGGRERRARGPTAAGDWHRTRA